VKIPKKILTRLEAHREALLRNGGIERRSGPRGITYRIRFRDRKRQGEPRFRSWKLPNEAVAREVNALIHKWRSDDEKARLAKHIESDNFKRLVAGCREDLESELRGMDISEGRKRATRRSFREAAREGVLGLLTFSMLAPLVTPPKDPGRPRRRRLAILTPGDGERASSPRLLERTKRRSGLSVYFGEADAPE
jgi:hypothetical protein